MHKVKQSLACFTGLLYSYIFGTSFGSYHFILSLPAGNASEAMLLRRVTGPALDHTQPWASISPSKASLYGPSKERGGFTTREVKSLLYLLA